MKQRLLGIFFMALLANVCRGQEENRVSPASQPAAAIRQAQARQVMEYIQKNFYDSQTHLYCYAINDKRPEFMWGNGVMFSALVAASRHDSQTYLPVMSFFFQAMDGYWDARATVPGYEPSQTLGVNDRYYDDNAWIVITFAEAFELTGDERYSTRAQEALRFVMSGWDDQQGGIWWHEQHRDGSKNTCSNAPAAVGCLRVARLVPADSSGEWIGKAAQIVDWTTKNLQSSDGLFADRIVVATGKVVQGKVTYNSALMIRALLGLYRSTGENRYLAQAKRIGEAARYFLNNRTHAYKDSVKWSHLLVEADLELYRATSDSAYLQRARDNADYYYLSWKNHPPLTLIDNAAIARLLWLVAEMESPADRAFWDAADRPRDRHITKAH